MIQTYTQNTQYMLFVHYTLVALTHFIVTFLRTVHCLYCCFIASYSVRSWQISTSQNPVDLDNNLLLCLRL